MRVQRAVNKTIYTVNS